MKKRLFFGKKGVEHELLMLVTQLLIPALVLLALLFWVNNQASNKDFDKNYIARDNSLLISAIYASPGNVVYTSEFKNYIINIVPNSVAAKSDEKDYPISYFFNVNSNLVYDSNGNSNIKERVNFVKVGSVFTTQTRDQTKNLKEQEMISCLDIKTSKPSSLGLDPIELVGKNTDITLQMAKIIKASLLSSVSEIKLTRDSGISRDLNEVVNSDMILGLRIKENTIGKNYIKIYYSINSNKKSESQKLGCLIANQIASKVILDGFSVVPVDTKSFLLDGPEKILDLDKYSVIIEIDSSSNGKNILENYADMSTAIADGVKEYG
jgi:hypothetical protein